MNKNIAFSLAAIILVIAAAAAYSNKNSVVPAISVEDQALQDNKIIISSVTAVDDSWLVIQTETNNVPGPVIGSTKIKKGENKNVSVVIDKNQATPKLFAMIHVDDGEKEKLDFPGADMPLMYKNEMVSKLFSLK